MDRSELLRSKIMDAHEKLWERIVEIKGDLPMPYGAVLGLFLLLTPKELEEAKGKPDYQFSTYDEAFLEMVDDHSLELIRPYIDETLWKIAKSRIAFAMRLLFLFSADTRNPVELTNWPEDELVRQHLRTPFTEKELEQFNYSRPGIFKDIVDLWEARIIAEIKKALFD